VRRISRTKYLVAALATLGLLAAACGSDDSPESEPSSVSEVADSAAEATTTEGSDDPIVVGIAAGFTGAMETFDVPAINGINLAIDELNENGGLLGRPIEIVTADTTSDIAEGARAGQEVIDAGADLIFSSPDFNFGGGAAREAQAAGLVVMAPGAGSALFGVEGIGDLAFTTGSAGSTDAALTAEWAIDEAGFETAYVLLDDTIDYVKEQCSAFEDRFEELGGEIVGSDTFKNGDASIAPIITRINALDTMPDMIELCSYPPGGASAVKQLRDAGIDVSIAANIAFDGSAWYSETLPDLSNFYYPATVSMFGNDPSDEVNEFVATYETVYGAPPGNINAYLGYVGMQALAVAVEEAGTTDGQAVATALEGFDQEPIAGITVTFSENIHIDGSREQRIIEIVSGEPQVATLRTVEEQPPLFGG
jgi:branched-chain amino acid transport system substrate-binding protein